MRPLAVSNGRLGMYLVQDQQMNLPTRLRPICIALLLALSASHVFAQDSAPAKLPDTTPWKLDALFQPPKFEWVDKEGPIRSLFYAGEPYGGKPTRVFAYYATPGTLAGDTSKDSKLPAMVLVHGGGGTAFREWCELWAKRGYAAIAMDLAGYRPHEGVNAHQRENRTRLEDGGPDQGDDEKFGSIDKPPEEQWPYHAVAAAIRAHSLIRSFPEVDPERTAVTGISWGGYLTCILAGVDSRFKAAVPVYGCGCLHENSAWLNRLNQMTDAQRERWITLWDPSRYLPSVSMPILFVNGTNDFAYPLDSYMRSFDAVHGEKQLCVTVAMPHGHPPGWAPKEIGLFVDQHLLQSDPLPILDAPVVDGDTVLVKFRSPVKLSQAALHFTADTNEINKRSWLTAAAKIEGDQITAPAPTPDVTAWFLTATDDRGAIISTRVVLPPAQQAGIPSLVSKFEAGAPVRIVCFGDSVTGVYYHTGGRRAYTDMVGIALKKSYPNADITMVNAGISGHNTENALARIEKDVLAHNPTLVTVMYGLNDMVGVPIEKYRENLKTIIAKCRERGAEVLLCTPNNVITTDRRPSTRLEEYCNAVREVGQSENVPVCDCYQQMQELREQDALNWRMLLSDEIHPNMAGHKRMAEMIARSICGRDASLDEVPPPSHPIERTLALLKAGQPVKIIAMKPFDELIRPALSAIAPDAKLEITTWDTAGKTLSQLEEEGKSLVRAAKPNLVIVAVPRAATADSDEGFIHSYAWILNWSLSFGNQEWDCVVVHPAVFEPNAPNAELNERVRKLVAAQDLTLIDRADGDQSTAEKITERFIQAQTAQ